MKQKGAKKKLYHMARLKEELDWLSEEMKEELFDDCVWSVREILYGCKIKDGVLLDRDGEEISRDFEGCEPTLDYFVNQSHGYLEDDYYGVMYFPIDKKGTVIAVDYSC